MGHGCPFMLFYFCFSLIATQAKFRKSSFVLPLERHRRLLDLLNEQQSVRTADLARRLRVTEETVRRDFEKLEKDGALLRTHGGAVRLDPARRERPVQDRARESSEKKLLIAKAALPLVETGQTVFFDSSTTVQTLASLLPDKSLTVITNSLQIPLLLTEKPSVRVILLGGSFRAGSLASTGMIAEASADFFRIDAAFMSCRGIDPDQGLSDAAEENARLKRHLVSRSKRFYLLADSSKANVASSFFFAHNSKVDLWITDALPPAPLRRRLESQGMKLEVAKP